MNHWHFTCVDLSLGLGQCGVTRNPCLQDGTHFHVPVDVYMPVTLGHCDEAEIVVMVSKPINPDSQMDENFSAMFQPPMHFSPDSPPAQISATQDLPVGKTFQYKVNIIHPPDICFFAQKLCRETSFIYTGY
ncbi:hypothetical protein ACJMK2_022320, partial [Sinanodonta woodiana]